MKRNIIQAIIIAIILGIFLSAYFTYASTKSEDYTVFYLVPNSYSNYIEGDSIVFLYGIDQHGKPSSKYIMDIYLGETLIASRDLKKKVGEKEIVLKVPEGIGFPTKVKLVLKTDHGTNDVHFWLQGRIDKNNTIT